MNGRRVSRRALLAWGMTATVLAACNAAAPTTPAIHATPEPTAEAPPTPIATPKPLPTPPTATRLTPIEEHYYVGINSEGGMPDLRADAWQLEVTGNVERPLTLTLADLRNDFEAVTDMRTLECISNPVGGNLISTVIWKGARLGDVLARAGVKAGTVEIKIESADRYSTSIPLDLAQDPFSLLAYEMAGQPVPRRHGHPVRCLFPGRYGQKQPKWVTRIEAITEPYLGFWEQQGWSNEAFIKINSRIETPAYAERIAADKYIISGLAFADTSGVTQVLVSVDDGRTWYEAQLLPGPTTRVWTHWWLEWETGENGSRIIKAKATDGKGMSQSQSLERRLLDVFPDGTSELHIITAFVRKEG